MPSLASPTISNSASSCSSVRMRSRASGSSSMIRTRVRGVVMNSLCDAEGGGGARRRYALERDLDEDRESAVLVGELQAVMTPVQTVESRACVRETDAGPECLQGAHL